MAEQHPARRTASNASPFVPSGVIPPPPPLPEPKRNAFTRFVTQPFSTYSSRPTTAQTGREGGRAAAFPQIPGYNPLTSQYTKFKTKVTAEIAALDINQDRTHAILAGREILETIRINGTTCSEELNIREALYSRDRHNATRHRDNLDIHDVKWSHGNYSNFIACAATNGKVVIYDLSRPGVEVARLHEHHRQVHKVSFSPHLGALLLSASHDGSVRLWDLRDMQSSVASISSKHRYSGLSEGVRDVRWSPTDALEFAMGTDNGMVQRWDHRNPKTAKLRINAHDSGCNSVDWHPDGKHLLSAGQDRPSGERSCGVLKVWDFSSDHKRQKPTWSLRTPYNVSNARWRPPCWSGDDAGRGSWQATQVVTAYDEKHPAVHLWDLRRPFIPFREMYTSKTAPTDFLWHSKDLLWSVGREGDFHQTDVKYAPKTIDRRPLSTFAISPTGELIAFGQKRSRRRYSDMELALPGSAPHGGRRGISRPGIPELSRSSADDSIDETFLSSSFQPKHHERTLSNRSTKSLAGTPPSLDDKTLASLDEAINSVPDNSLPQQNSMRGPLPGTANASTFLYLAQKYKTLALPEHPSVEDYEHAYKAFEQNAEYASRTGHHRAAQTWMHFSGVLMAELRQHSEERRQSRLKRLDSPCDPLLEMPIETVVVAPDMASPTTEPDEPELVRPKHSYGGVRFAESDSNMPTPLAKPQGTSSSIGSRDHQRALPEPPNDDQLSLPPSVMSKESSSSEIDQMALRRPSRPHLADGLSWFSANDLNERKAQVASYRAPPKIPLDFDTPARTSSPAMPIPPSMDRHNSDDSFAMFPSSSESKIGLSLAASQNSFRDRKPSMGSIAEDDQHGGFGVHDQPNSGSTSFSQLPDETPDSQSGSSKSDLFNGSFDSLQLSESPLGTKSVLPTVYNRHLAETNDQKGMNGAPKHPGSLRPNVLVRARTAAPAVQPLKNSNSKELILEDYQRQPLATTNRNFPVTSGKLLEKSFAYHTALIPDSQQLFHLTALMMPFLPNTSAITGRDIKSDIQQHRSDTKQTIQEYARYCQTDIGLSAEDTYLILADHLAHLVRFNIHPFLSEAIFMAYQEQLERSMLFTASTVLRNLLYPSFGAFREHLLDNSGIGLVCIKCNKPVNAATGKCEKCSRRPDPCPVCWQKFSPFVMTKRARKMEEAKVPTIKIGHNGRLHYLPMPEETSRQQATLSTARGATDLDEKLDPPVLWQFCLTCGHGAHAACMLHHQKVPEIGGRCPTTGCGCACVPGLYRDQTIKKQEEEKAVKAAGTVRGDGRRVRESGAVRGARGLLGGGGGSGSGGQRVRLVEPEK